MKLFFRIYLWTTALFLGLESLFRLLFYYLYVPEQKILSLDFLNAFILGMRFDLTVVSYVHGFSLLFIFIYSLFVSRYSKTLLSAIRYYYLLMLSVVLMLNVSDIFFYSYFQDRLNVLIFGFFEDDTIALLKTIWSDYPVIRVVSLGVAVIWFLNWILKERVFLALEALNIKKRIHILLFLFVFFIANGIGARGGFALFPLSEMDLEITPNASLNLMAYNSARAFARAIELRDKMTRVKDINIKDFGYEGKIDQAISDYFNGKVSNGNTDIYTALEKTGKSTSTRNKNPHVVVVVMEGWGQYWLRYDSGNFDLAGEFKQHRSEDFFTSHCLPSTEGTIGSLSAIMVGQIHRYRYNFLSESNNFKTEFKTSPARIYGSNGYETRLIYGGNPGWRELGKFARAQGYAYVAGDHEIRSKLSKKIETHPWGVHDEDLFAYVLKILEEAKKPQFLMIMTTSNHPPFVLPSSYRGPNLKIPQEITNNLNTTLETAESRFKTYRYSMDVLGGFLNRIKSGSLKDQTLVAATGDHNFWLIKFSDEQKNEKYGVPFYLYLPQEYRSDMETNQKKFSESYCSQQDILPTLYEKSLPSSRYWSFGENIFSPHRDNFAFDGIGLALSPDGFVLGGREIVEKANVEGARERLEKLKVRYGALHSLIDYYFSQEEGIK